MIMAQSPTASDWLIFSHFSKIKTLGESDDEDENAATWVRRVRKMQKEKALAEKRVSVHLSTSSNGIFYIVLNLCHGLVVRAPA